MRPTVPPSTWLKGLSALFLIGTLTGCSTTPLDRARGNFYAGHLEQAEENLTPIPEDDKDQILFLMERGMIRQALYKYDDSSTDWRTADEQDKLLETYSISRGAASLLTNDRTLSFRGKPYERTLLFAFLANNYLAQHNWDYAAICARNIVQQLENLNGFPDIAYGRYMAGFCLELIEDMGNAALQYRTASELLPTLSIEDNTGQLIPQTEYSTNRSAPAQKSEPYELVCFVALGRATSGYLPPVSSDPQTTNMVPVAAPYAEIYSNDKCLGRSYPFNNTERLMAETEQQEALLQMAKDISRIAIKETIAESLDQQNELLGLVARIALFSMEAPDNRRWETLPLWLEIARLPCPAPLASYTVVFKDPWGQTTGKKTIVAPISRRGNVFISFVRDISDAETANESARQEDIHPAGPTPKDLPAAAESPKDNVSK